MNRLLTLLTLGLLVSGTAWGQTRYLDEVFPDVTITEDVIYGNNITVITGAPAASDLMMDVYEPTGDTESTRPVVIFAPTGNFLPRITNGSPVGTRRDSTPVEICTRLAKMGYVAISFSYRQGWNPVTTDQNTRTATLLQAAYRGIQDARNVVRFLRANVDTAGNDYKVDPNRIAVGGVGTGGYVALGTGYLNEFSEILVPKFFNLDSTPPEPYVDSTLHGNIWGTNTTPINNPNYATYSSDIHFCFNMGGALGDSSWVDAGEVPSVAFHTPLDPFAPYKTGPVIVPTTGDFVVEATGSYDVVRKANEMGNNDIFVNANFTDVYTMAANVLNDGYEGLFPFDRPFTAGDLDCGIPGVMLPLVPEASPWDWWDQAQFIADWDAIPGQTVPGVVANCNQLTSNPDMSATKGRAYIDSVMGYLAPRMVLALSLDTAATSIEDDLLAQRMQLFPNPAATSFQVRLNDDANSIRNIEVMDMTGRIVMSRQNLRVQSHTFERGNLTGGIYFVRVRATNGAVATRKLVIE